MLNWFEEIKRRLNVQQRILVGSGAPTSGTSGTGVNDAGPMSEYIDYTNFLKYYNVGTAASPLWAPNLSGAGVKSVITSFTIAQINAGATLLPAVVGYAPQIVRLAMISVGGAAAAATTVDVYGVQATVTVKLLAVAVAALTQSALVNAGGTNATILADAASFAVNDSGSALTVGKTGSSLTTSVSILVICEYILVKV